MEANGELCITMCITCEYLWENKLNKSDYPQQRLFDVNN